VKIKRTFLTVSFIICLITSLYSQEREVIKSKDSIITLEKELNPLAPATAAFYSAILPGLGQAYNKKYWKIPVVYAALGTSAFFYIDNNKKYNQFRDAFQLLESGKPHEFDGIDGNTFLSRDTLIRAQTRFKEDRDLSLLITVGIYVLQIVEASVNAHLSSINTNDDLTLNPQIIIDPITNKTIGGMVLTYNF
jgi:hypothetical protein